MLDRHYAPRLPLRLAVTEVRGDEALLAFGEPVPSGSTITLNLSPSGDLAEAAANLFAMLRTLDRPGRAEQPVDPVRRRRTGIHPDQQVAFSVFMTDTWPPCAKAKLPGTPR